MDVEQKNVTRNQSTALYTLEHIFIFDNRYDEKTFNNTTATAQVTLLPGHLLFKLNATDVDLLDAAANIANVVGICAVAEENIVADAGTLPINMAIQGDIAEEGLVLTGGVTLDTVIPTTQLTLRDRLNELGFHLVSGVENTKHDNN